MNCLDFRRIALAEPDGQQDDYIEHRKACVDCAAYLQSIKQMDTALASSLDVTMPSELTARLQLNQELVEETKQRGFARRFAIAASILFAFVIGGLSISNQFAWQQDVSQDYQSLLAGVSEHMQEVPQTPVWNVTQANQSVQTLLASYDQDVKWQNLPTLQFGKICPMGKYKGLHASLETADGAVTFAYIKGDSVKEPISVIYNGQMAKVKPLKNGNLIIISPTERGLTEADNQLNKALYWDI